MWSSLKYPDRPIWHQNPRHMQTDLHELWQFILTWLDVCANEKLKYKVTVRLDFVL